MKHNSNRTIMFYSCFYLSGHMCSVHGVPHDVLWDSSFNDESEIQRIANKYCGISSGEMLLLEKKKLKEFDILHFLNYS